jgi:hypothetical protein
VVTERKRGFIAIPRPGTPITNLVPFLYVLKTGQPLVNYRSLLEDNRHLSDSPPPDPTFRGVLPQYDRSRMAAPVRGAA